MNKMEVSAIQTNGATPVRSNCIDGVAHSADNISQLIPIAEISDALNPFWKRLSANCSEPNIFYEPWFLMPSIESFAGDSELYLFLIWSGEPYQSELNGLLPIGRSNQFGRWPVPHVQNWMHHNSFLGTPLVRGGFEHTFWESLFLCVDDGHWPGFLHINGMTIGGKLDLAMRQVCEDQMRRCDLVHSQARALLASALTPDDYYIDTVRSKKRKELRRQAKRLGEMGDVKFTHACDDSNLEQWTADFLKLERDGWKGTNGSALDCHTNTRDFFRAILACAAAHEQLDRHAVYLDGQPLAMLVNFKSSFGSFSFKTSFDEKYARFSPGVLLQLKNLEILNDPEIQWMDSCAAEDHPMIDSLWSGRRHIGRFSIELSGLSRKALFRGVRLGEDFMAHIKGREIIDIMQVSK